MKDKWFPLKRLQELNQKKFIFFIGDRKVGKRAFLKEIKKK